MYIELIYSVILKIFIFYRVPRENFSVIVDPYLWKRIRNGDDDDHEEIHSFYRSPNIVRVIKSIRLRWADHVARMKEGRSAFEVLIGKPTGKRLLGRPRRTWEDNIIMDLKGIGRENSTIQVMGITFLRGILKKPKEERIRNTIIRLEREV